MREAALHVVIVTGLSGSGKSTAIRVLEDLGFYCIDNLPVVLTPKFIELCQNSEEEIMRVALGIDLRERAFLADYPAVLEDIRRAGRIRSPKERASPRASDASARSSPA